MEKRMSAAKQAWLDFIKTEIGSRPLWTLVDESGIDPVELRAAFMTAVEKHLVPVSMGDLIMNKNPVAGRAVITEAAQIANAIVTNAKVT